MVFFILAFGISALGQVTVAGSTGADGSYTTLKGAFDAINANAVQTGNAISITVTANTTETATAALNAGDWGSVNIRPTGAGRIIEGSIVGAIIKLNGADRVTIDGRVGGVGTNRDLTVRNNNTSTATAAIWLASVVAGNGAQDNVIRNLEIAAGQTANTGTNSTFGIIQTGTTISLTSTDGNDNDNNQFIFNRVIRARFGISSRGVTTNNNLNPVITDNIVGPTSFGADEIGANGIYMQADTGAIVSRNTVQFVGGDFANLTTFGDRCGICIGSNSIGPTTTTTITSGDYTVTNNVIHDIVDERTGSAAGIALGTTRSGVATNNLIANNFIYNLRANGTAGDWLVGIQINNGHTDTIVFNSISITGDQDPGAASSSTQYGAGIRINNVNAANNVNFTVANNSFYFDPSCNTATTHYYAMMLPSAAYVFGTGFQNYNNYYRTGANAQVYTGGFATVSGAAATTEFVTLANWQAALTAPQDAQSIQADPLYASNTADLHLLGASPNINVGLTIAGIADDIDAQVRPNGANPDIGADEFYAAPGALQFSSATYGGNEGTTLVGTVNRVSGSSGIVGVTVTLTDGSGTGGAACGVGVDYVNPGPQLLSFGDSVTSQPVNVTLCTDAVADPAETFTLTLSLPTGGATLGSPTVATATITDVPPPFSGSFNVGTAQTYTSLTNPGGIFEAINLGGVSGNVTINITSDLTGESGSVALNQFAAGFTVTIKPSGAARSITSTASAISVIHLNEADNVTIDGSLSGGTDRSLSITNTNPAASTAVIWLTGATNGAQSNTVKNTNLAGGFDQSTGSIFNFAIIASSSTILTGGTDLDNNTYTNNFIRKVSVGIISIGGLATNMNQNTTISKNTIGPASFGSDQISTLGILAFNENAMSIVDNEIRTIGDLATTGGSSGRDHVGISLCTGNATWSATSSAAPVGNMTNALVARNKVHDIIERATFSAAGIVENCPKAAATNNTFANNMIYNIQANGTVGDQTTGLGIWQGNGDSFVFNSINLTGDIDPGAASSSSQSSNGIFIGNSTAANVPVNVTVKDNISVMDLSSNTVTLFHAAIAIPTAFVWGTGGSDYNDWYAPAANPQARVGSVGGTFHTTLASWQAATTQDANSKEVDPLFTSATDLHLQATSTLTSMGTPVTGITNDFDNDPRPAANPDIGADEVVMSTAGVIPGGTYYNVSTAPGETLGGNVTVTGTIRFLGVLNDGGFTLTIGCGATVTNQGTFNYFTGAVIKNFCGPESFLFPVGTFPDGTTVGNASEYTPVTANVTALGINPSSLSVQSFDATLFPFNAATSIDRNWALIETGDITADLSFTYIDGDVNGNEADYRVWRRDGNTPNNLCPGAPCINTGTNTAGPVLGVMQFSRWTVAEAVGPVAAHVNVGGRVTMADGLQGLPRVQVVLSGDGTQPRIVMTNPFGYFNFEDLEVGRTYILTVGSKEYTFMNPTIVVTPDDNVSDANFFANP